MKKKNLSFFFRKNNCDKFTHQYHTVYEKYLSKNKNKKLNIFEIGVADGSSLKSWSAFFKKSNIIGIDIKKINLKKRGIDKKNIKVYEGSQTDKKILSNIISKYKNFDIIIDDGSHYPNDVIKTFEILFCLMMQISRFFEFSTTSIKVSTPSLVVLSTSAPSSQFFSRYSLRVEAFLPMAFAFHSLNAPEGSV